MSTVGQLNLFCKLYLTYIFGSTVNSCYNQVGYNEMEIFSRALNALIIIRL